MFRVFLCLIFIGLFSKVSAFSENNIGFREVELDKDGYRPLHVSLWYPSKSHDNAITIGENKAFYGISVIRSGKPDSHERALIVLSHGYGGNWRNLNWLAKELVKQGYIVAAPDHPGTTAFDRDPQQASMLWERPRDLSRVIDMLIENPSYAGKVDADRIAAIGHSLGGWTVTALAGIRFDTVRFASDCSKNTNLFACTKMEELGLRRSELNKNMGDPRVRAFVTLDLGFARGFSPESLASNKISSLVIGAGIDIGDMPTKLESGYLAEYLPKNISSYIILTDAMHFSFMQTCKPDAITFLEIEEPRSVIICKDGKTGGRNQIHHEVADYIAEFLGKIFNEK